MMCAQQCATGASHRTVAVEMSFQDKLRVPANVAARQMTRTLSMIFNNSFFNTAIINLLFKIVVERLEENSSQKISENLSSRYWNFSNMLFINS